MKGVFEMLLYALYTPAKITKSVNKKVFAFASIESCMYAMRYYNFGKDRLELVTREFLIEMAIPTATLMCLAPESRLVEDKAVVFVNGNCVKEGLLGQHHEIFLAEYAKDEVLPANVIYP